MVGSNLMSNDPFPASAVRARVQDRWRVTPLVPGRRAPHLRTHTMSAAGPRDLHNLAADRRSDCYVCGSDVQEARHSPPSPGRHPGGILAMAVDDLAKNLGPLFNLELHTNGGPPR